MAISLEGEQQLKQVEKAGYSEESMEQVFRAPPAPAEAPLPAPAPDNFLSLKGAESWKEKLKKKRKKMKKKSSMKLSFKNKMGRKSKKSRSTKGTSNYEAANVLPVIAEETKSSMVSAADYPEKGSSFDLDATVGTTKEANVNIPLPASLSNTAGCASQTDGRDETQDEVVEALDDAREEVEKESSPKEVPDVSSEAIKSVTDETIQPPMVSPPIASASSTNSINSVSAAAAAASQEDMTVKTGQLEEKNGLIQKFDSSLNQLKKLKKKQGKILIYPTIQVCLIFHLTFHKTYTLTLPT
jgi:hypothetical protein